MPHISISDLAKTVTASEKSKTLETLASTGRSAAINTACNFLHSRTGLSKAHCKPAAVKVVNTLSKALRARIKRST